MSESRPGSFDLEKAKRLQSVISKLVKLKAIDVDTVENVCGVDTAYAREEGEEIAVSCACVYEMRNGVCKGIYFDLFKELMPYVSGHLFLRELPGVLRVLRKAKKECALDVVLVDGHGIAHPRRSGLAVFVGVITKLPTIGVAKSRLVGEIVEREGGKFVVLNGEVVGTVVTHGKRQLIVSPGNLIDTESAHKMVKLLIERGIDVMKIAHLNARRKAKAILRSQIA